jgi:two-component system, chemotaxis family, protein-glutamate methylesterase/glutaminase
MLNQSPRIELCGSASNGAEAIEMARELRPDVITLDVIMPVLDGIQALRQIMHERPCPVIMISALTRRNAEATLEAMALGAFDYIAKEDLYRAGSSLQIRNLLLDRIEAAVQSPISARRQEFQLGTIPGLALQRRAIGGGLHAAAVQIIAIGASTGGPKVLQDILSLLPGDLPAPIVIAQHMPPGFTDTLAIRLNGLCEVRVHEARQGEAVHPGTVYIAPGGKQMTIFSSTHSLGRICLSDLPANTPHKPSVDVLMRSVANVFEDHAVGIVLTGMGSDGLRGMTAIHEHGGITIGQDQATSAVYGMPRVCAEHGILQKILAPSAIAIEILDQCSTATPA